MKKIIYRNIAIVSAIFIVAFSIMLVTNYFQVRGSSPLQTEVVETLKQLNDANADNPALQEQIRQLDLLARRAYFVHYDSLMTGIYILLGMLAVFIFCARGYYADSKDIPDKDIDPVDEWAIKTKARKYVVWGVSVLAATTLVFTVLSSSHLKTAKTAEQPEIADNTQYADDTVEQETDILSEPLKQEDDDDDLITETTETDDVEKTDVTEETAPQPVISKVTHNAFRGNNSNGISSAKNVPVKWNLSTGAKISWKHDLPLQGHSSPVINSNKVFITAADEHLRELYCYDLTTGEKLWTLKAENIQGSPANAPETTDDTGLAASGVAVNGTQVCAIFGTGDIICADMNGNRLWAKNIGVPDIHYGYVASLLTFGNLLIVQYDVNNNPRVMALDIATGAELWSKARTEKTKMTWTSPIIAYINSTPQLVLVGSPGIVAYNPNNGEQLWRVEGLMGELTASACSANGIVYAASEYAKLIAVNAADGTVLWDSNDFLPEIASPVATRDNVYVATSYGVFASYDAQTGKLRKEHELGDGFYSSPIIADGKIFIINTEGKVHIFSADDGFNLLDSFETGEKTTATPAFTDGRIVVRTEKSIYCVNN